MSPSNTHFDAIVVGSGITGGWAAKELTEGGLKVLLIERGRLIEHQAGYTSETLAPWDLPFRGEGDAALYAREYAVQSRNRSFDEWTQDHFVNDVQQPYAVAEGSDFTWFRSYQLGGRSLTWGRQCYRWSDYDFGANKADGNGTDWPIRYTDLEDWYDRVEEFIGVSGSVEHLPQLPDGRFQPPMAMNVVERRVSVAIAAKYPERRLIIGRTANLTQEKGDRAACQYRNICARGCSYGAYFSTQSSTLPAANATGNLTLLTDCKVDQVVYDPAAKRATGVRVTDLKTGTGSQFSARMIFLNAGAFNTVHLMLRSMSETFPRGLANGSGVLGTHIMDHATALSLVSSVQGFADRTTYGNRPTGCVIPRFRNLDRDDGVGFHRGYSYQGGALQSGWTRAKRESGLGIAFKRAHRGPGEWRMVLVTFAECLPRETNRLSLDPMRRESDGTPMLRVNFHHGENEHRALQDAQQQARSMMALVDAREITSSAMPNPGGSAIHEMGGARMGWDPSSSVLNRNNQAHEIANLFVTDGACMSSSACQNPSLTYMALTARACATALSMVKEGHI